MQWQPSATLHNLKRRSEIIDQVRAFFKAKNVLEVETPLLSHATVTDVHLQSFMTYYQTGDQQQPLYLQTSPEFAMKRLLAAGSGAIFQICKSFRNDGEFGKFHNPEFTMLEWYRPGFTHVELMNETDDFLQDILKTSAATRLSYAQAFKLYADIDPHGASLEQLRNRALAIADLAQEDFAFNDRDSWLQLLMIHLIEPKLGRERPTFIYDFPASQAALSRIRAENPPLAERFEVYIDGIELANGFHELTNGHEQAQRFKHDLQVREKLGYPLPPMDQHLLAALAHGLPACAGIALGIDRLVMLATKSEKLADVMSFSLQNA